MCLYAYFFGYYFCPFAHFFAACFGSGERRPRARYIADGNDGQSKRVFVLRALSVWRHGDEDFHIAMSMVEVLIEHSLLLSLSLPDMALKLQPLESFHQASAIMTHLPIRFSYTGFMNQAIKNEISKSTSKRILKRVTIL